MALWKQVLVSILLALVAVVAAARFLPSTHPALARAGLLGMLSAAGLAAPSGQESGDAAGGPGRPGGAGGGPLPVVAVAPVPQVLRDTVTAIGTARAGRSVTLAAEVPGQIVALWVKPGDRVEAGAPIAELDSESARIAVERAELMISDARATRERLARLQSSGATTGTTVQEAELALRTAELELRAAEYELAQHRLLSPISGVVGLLGPEVGSRLAADDEVTTIEDRAQLIVEFRVPERVVGRLSVGDPVTASPLADPALVLDGTVSAIDNRVDDTSRTLRLQAQIGNADDRLRSGMALLISLSFTGTEHPAVDPLAIQWGNDGAFVWIVREGRALRQPVRILQRTGTLVLVDMAVQEGDLVVTEGVQSLRPDAEVTPVPAGDATARPRS